MTTFQSGPGSPGQSQQQQQQRPNGQQGFGQRMDHLNTSAHQLIDEARGMVADFTQNIDLRGRVDRHPYGMMLAAIGVGYVLGGGLFTPFTGKLLRLGLRLAMLPIVKDELIGMAEVAISGARSASSEPSPAAPGGTPTV